MIKIGSVAATRRASEWLLITYYHRRRSLLQPLNHSYNSAQQINSQSHRALISPWSCLPWAFLCTGNRWLAMSKQNVFYNLIDDVSEQTVSYWDTCRIAYNKIPNQTEFSEHFVVTLMQAAPARLGDSWIAGHNFVSCGRLSMQRGSSRSAMSVWRMINGTTSPSSTDPSIYASEVSECDGQLVFELRVVWRIFLFDSASAS